LVVYTVYEPPNASGDPVDRAERFLFVKDGFLWLAAIFPAIWLLVKGLWLEFIVFLVAVTGLTWGLEALGATAIASAVPLLIVQIIFGFEAGAIQGAALERRGWHMAGTITGRNRSECECRFFAAWLASPPAAQATVGAPLPQNALHSWMEVASRTAKDAIVRGRRLIGAKV